MGKFKRCCCAGAHPSVTSLKAVISIYCWFGAKGNSDYLTDGFSWPTQLVDPELKLWKHRNMSPQGDAQDANVDPTSWCPQPFDTSSPSWDTALSAPVFWATTPQTISHSTPQTLADAIGIAIGRLSGIDLLSPAKYTMDGVPTWFQYDGVSVPDASPRTSVVLIGHDGSYHAGGVFIPNSDLLSGEAAFVAAMGAVISPVGWQISPSAIVAGTDGSLYSAMVRKQPGSGSAAPNSVAYWVVAMKSALWCSTPYNYFRDYKASFDGSFQRSAYVGAFDSPLGIGEHIFLPSDALLAGTRAVFAATPPTAGDAGI